MASSDVLSQTLSSITSIKLEELSIQRAAFEDGKAQLLNDVAHEPNQRKKVAMLLGRMEDLASMGKVNPLVALKNVRQFIEQSRTDPSVSDRLQKDWQSKLENELNVHTSKYEYASLYGKLVNEWLASGSSEKMLSDSGSDFQEVGRREMHDQRVLWEEYVFKAKDTDAGAIHKYLHSLFTPTKEIDAAYQKLRSATRCFEHNMATTVHFDEDTLKWVIQGLLRSDLVTDEKRKVLKDFLNNKVVLAEIADVLNMRMSSLDKWQWGSEGIPIKQRRQLNGRYRFYHDEDLLQTLLLRYVGVKWSVFFKKALSDFQSTSDVWKSSSVEASVLDQQRRKHFLGKHSSLSVEFARKRHFEEIFLDHLQDNAEEKRGAYNDDSEDDTDTRKSSQDITQGLLHVLASEIIMKTRLGEDICVVRSDFKWFGPSLPHSTMFAILRFFEVSETWIDFFRRALEAPMKFVEDGPNAPIQTRKRGTPISGPLSDMLGETTLFVLDLAMNQLTDGARLYRLHDDIWFWGQEKTCIKGWAVMTEYAKLMGLHFNEEKTGSVRITRKPNEKNVSLSSKLPKGDVRWGFLKLDASSGKFIIDRDNVNKHIKELRRQLGACKSVFDWIQAWNVYGARFFTTNFGRPANCYGLAHVDMMLETFSHIQNKLFATTGGSVTSNLKQMITERFGVQDVPEGYLYFPMSMGGLDLKSPFVNLYLIRDKVSKNPDEYMDTFFQDEEKDYRNAKRLYDSDPSRYRGLHGILSEVSPKFQGKSFISFEEYARYREQTSSDLYTAYSRLIEEPMEDEVVQTNDVKAVIGDGWESLSPYYRWIVQLYAPDMIARFGGLNVVEKGLLPTGMVNMMRESRFKWQE